MFRKKYINSQTKIIILTYDECIFLYFSIANYCKLIFYIIKKYFESQLKYMLRLKWVTCNRKKYQVFSRSNNLCCNKYAKRKMEGNLLFNVWISFFSPSMNISFYIFLFEGCSTTWIVQLLWRHCSIYSILSVMFEKWYA